MAREAAHSPAGASNIVRSVDRGRRMASGKVPAFDTAKVPYTEHFAERVSKRAGRGVTGQTTLDAYNRGTRFYDPVTKAYIRYDRKTGVAVVLRDGVNSPAHTAFHSRRPSPRWNPIPFGSGR